LEIRKHILNEFEIAEVFSDEFVIQTSDDGLELLGNLYYVGFDRVIVYERSISPDFFVLKNGIAGEVLQKFSNYRVRLAIVGNFSRIESKSLRDFIVESNAGKQVNFVSSLAEALVKLSNN
jgi:hypothetical protein